MIINDKFRGNSIFFIPNTFSKATGYSLWAGILKDRSYIDEKIELITDKWVANFTLKTRVPSLYKLSCF